MTHTTISISRSSSTIHYLPSTRRYTLDIKERHSFSIYFRILRVYTLF
jgi:hypothetical protein